MIYADVKADIKEQKIKNWWLYLRYFIRIKCEKGIYFHLVLNGIPSSLILFVKNRVGRGRGHLTNEIS